MSIIDFQDGGSGGHLGFSIGSFSYFVSTRCPNAHYQVLIQQEYRGDVQNMNSQHFYTPPHNSGRVLWFHVGRPWVRPLYVRPSVFRFQMITWVNINGFSPNLVCALVLWRSGLGLLMGKFRQFLRELSARDTPIFSFPDYNLSK